MAATQPGRDATVLTLEDINQLLVEAGSDVVATSSSFVQINASNEAQYLITHAGGEDHVFISQDALYNFHLMINVPTDPSGQ